MFATEDARAKIFGHEVAIAKMFASQVGGSKITCFASRESKIMNIFLIKKNFNTNVYCKKNVVLKIEEQR
jgi:hypothetical protein